MTLVEPVRGLVGRDDELAAGPEGYANQRATRNDRREAAIRLEAMQSARDLLLTARSQQRDVMEQASTAAQGAVARATATTERASSDDPSFQDIEYIRMFARVAQVQFRAVLDALNEQVNRLSDVPEMAEPPRPVIDREPLAVGFGNESGKAPRHGQHGEVASRDLA